MLNWSRITRFQQKNFPLLLFHRNHHLSKHLNRTCRTSAFKVSQCLTFSRLLPTRQENFQRNENMMWKYFSSVFLSISQNFLRLSWKVQGWNFKLYPAPLSSCRATFHIIIALFSVRTYRWSFWVSIFNEWNFSWFPWLAPYSRLYLADENSTTFCIQCSLSAPSSPQHLHLHCQSH